MSHFDERLLDHEYDGIKELDNDLPRWWLWLFYLAIVWSIVYVTYYHVLDVGYLQYDEYMQEMNPYYVRVSKSDGKLLGVVPEYHSPYFKPGDTTPRMLVLGGPQEIYLDISRESDTATYEALADQASLTVGKELFIKNCTSCHGSFGEGGIGPNLTDNYWLHGAGMTSVVKTIKYGYPAKGMISWRGFLKPEQIMQVASYVLTLKGTNPPNGKAPQGDLVED